ncbi:hypothetical protein [Pseudovibrio brasiliensis]|uniref:hypothetical protein n=1 Tax=Pseudovibrio brasiliensis TaxID=1898042 RepID=UPI000B2E5808|nr:hypothetical protein [Pseudovibrio brasiliensis]
MRRLAHPLGSDPAIEAGESAAAGLAAAIEASKDPQLCSELGLTPNSRIILIGSEGVTDPEIYAQIMEDS